MSQNYHSNSYLNATGKIPYSMTNDYMFHAVPQRNPNILKGLIAAILHLNPEDITHIEIKNPILPGESIKDKGFILDIITCINHDTFVNLEMQVINQHDWPERSLSYLCRSFDQLSKGQEYDTVLPAIHIGFLDFRPFEDNLEFFSTYKLLNIKNLHLYSDKFVLNVIDLTHINLATDEDKAYHIDHWAKLFKATTWEEMKMLANKDEYMDNLAQTLYECNDDFIIREQCRAREDEIRDKARLNRTIAKQEQLLQEKDAVIENQESVIENQESIIEDLSAEITRLKSLLSQDS